MKNINTTETTAMVCFSFGSVATVGVTLYEGLSIDECIALRSEDIEEYKIQGGEWTTRKATAEEARQHLEALSNETPEAEATLDQKAREYFEIQQQIAELEALAEAIKDAVKAAMVEAGKEELDGIGWRATWHNTTTNRFDSAGFKKAHGDLYSEFCKPVTGTRFTLNQIKAA